MKLLFFIEQSDSAKHIGYPKIMQGWLRAFRERTRRNTKIRIISLKRTVAACVFIAKECNTFATSTLQIKRRWSWRKLGKWWAEDKKIALNTKTSIRAIF
ncbi:MAG: hypothetical protein BGN96_12160 [Bacteroidales bacterium 45-6]|nr:MAG: hypothetical protein BGN96_12160 [Bacteroidales bacterium 45-6]